MFYFIYFYPPLSLACSRPRHHVHRRKDGSRWQINLCRKCEYISNRRLIVEQFPPISSSLTLNLVSLWHIWRQFSLLNHLSSELTFWQWVEHSLKSFEKFLSLQDCGQGLSVSRLSICLSHGWEGAIIGTQWGLFISFKVTTGGLVVNFILNLIIHTFWQMFLED